MRTAWRSGHRSDQQWPPDARFERPRATGHRPGDELATVALATDPQDLPTIAPANIEVSVPEQIPRAVVTGLGAMMPIGNDFPTYWRNLRPA